MWTGVGAIPHGIVSNPYRFIMDLILAYITQRPHLQAQHDRHVFIKAILFVFQAMVCSVGNYIDHLTTN